jgi:hypothetical protein
MDLLVGFDNQGLQSLEKTPILLHQQSFCRRQGQLIPPGRVVDCCEKTLMFGLHEIMALEQTVRPIECLSTLHAQAVCDARATFASPAHRVEEPRPPVRGGPRGVVPV